MNINYTHYTTNVLFCQGYSEINKKVHIQWECSCERPAMLFYHIFKKVITIILSRLDLEAIAAAIMKDFFQVYYGDELDNPNRFVLATPINALAKDYLGLKVSYAPLSPDGSICGLTSYSDTSYTIRIDQQPYAIQLKRNQVILDLRFHNCEKNSGLFRRRRFTLAHECAHQILFQLASDEEKEICANAYSERNAYLPYELKTREDWNEWQANVLGAAILLPQTEVDRAMYFLTKSKPLSSSADSINCNDKFTLSVFCGMFGVSIPTAVRRLVELGYMKFRKEVTA